VQRSVVLTSAVVALLVSALAIRALAEDWSRYQPRSIADLLNEYPPQEDATLTKDVPIRARVRYTGEFRPLSTRTAVLITLWGKVMKVEGVSGLFRREMKIQEGDTPYWVPVQETLAPALEAELGPGEEIEVFVVYIGQIGGHHVLLANAFTHDNPHLRYEL
jgi:hypothetical protein